MAIDHFGNHVPYWRVRLNVRLQVIKFVPPARYSASRLQGPWQKIAKTDTVSSHLSLSAFAQIQFREYLTFQVPCVLGIPDLLIRGLSRQPLGFLFFLYMLLIGTGIWKCHNISEPAGNGVVDMGSSLP